MGGGEGGFDTGSGSGNGLWSETGLGSEKNEIHPSFKKGSRPGIEAATDLTGTFLTLLYHCCMALGDPHADQQASIALIQPSFSKFLNENQRTFDKRFRIIL